MLKVEKLKEKITTLEETINSATVMALSPLEFGKDILTPDGLDLGVLPPLPPPPPPPPPGES